MSDEQAGAPPLETLKALLDAQALKLGVHIRKMNSPGSPVYRYFENVWPVALILTGSFLGTVAVHYYLGGAIMAAGIWWWLARIQPRIKDGVFERSSAWALQSEVHFDALWAKGVLSLYAELPDGTKLAATRRDDWRAFAQRVAQATGRAA
jgi:hypothetical protein